MSRRILLGYSYYPYAVDIRTWVDDWVRRLCSYGFRVDTFCLTPNPPREHYRWRELNARWRRGDVDLMRLYEELARRAEGYDVFVNWNGVNLHPEFVRQLPVTTVYGCFDDPESSEELSKPVAWSYDLAMVGNVAEIETYRAWGVKNVRLWPLGFHYDDYDPSLTKEKILSGQRDVDITLLCEHVTDWRARRLDRFALAFPDGSYYGRGWPRGFLPESERIPLLQRTKIGPNFHNSTGPINFRTFVLPANGVLQVCDNKSHLGELFEVGREAVGFETVEEAIDLCRYYLAHEEERRVIAAAGWERAMRDYNEKACFQRLMDAVQELVPEPKRHVAPVEILGFLKKHAENTAWRRTGHAVLQAAGLSKLGDMARRGAARLKRAMTGKRN